jgi:hypothetical protein
LNSKFPSQFVGILIASFAIVASLFATRPAHAEPGMPRLTIDWEKLASALRDGGETLVLPRETTTVRVPTTNERERFIGVSPHVSLVARDWSGVQLLMGHVALTDQMRLSRSSRMVVTRVRLADGQLRPFAQLGLGQWRLDTDLMPVMPKDVELASQLGGGFELSITRGWVAAVEADYTILYREQHEISQVTGPRIWGAFLASRARF